MARGIPPAHRGAAPSEVLSLGCPGLPGPGHPSKGRIGAYPLNKALEHVDTADVLLLGPQIAYAKKDAEAAAGSMPVAVIAMVDYGRMHAKKILADALKLMRE